MKTKPTSLAPKDGTLCHVIGGVHAGKSGHIRDLKTGKTGHLSLTVVQADGVRFKTLAKNVVPAEPGKSGAAAARAPARGRRALKPARPVRPRG